MFALCHGSRVIHNTPNHVYGALTIRPELLRQGRVPDGMQSLEEGRQLSPKDGVSGTLSSRINSERRT